MFYLPVSHSELLGKPYTPEGIPLGDMCTITRDSARDLINNNIAGKPPRPKVLVVGRDVDGGHHLFDPESLHTHFTINGYKNPNTNKIFDQLHYFVVGDMKNGAIHLETCEIPSKFVRTYALACSQNKTQEVLSARKELYFTLLEKKDYEDAIEWLKLTVEEFPEDNFAKNQLKKLLPNGENTTTKEIIAQQAEKILQEDKPRISCLAWCLAKISSVVGGVLNIAADACDITLGRDLQHGIPLINLSLQSRMLILAVIGTATAILSPQLFVAGPIITGTGGIYRQIKNGAFLTDL